MPIINQNSYISTMAAFAAHWPLVNIAIAPDVVTLQNGYTLANFNTDRTALQAAFDAVQQQNTLLGRSRNTLNAQRSAMMKRMEAFRTFITGAMPNSNYALLLPKTPGMSAIESRFLQAFAAMQNLWQMIATDPPPGFTNPIKLQGNYQLATFNTDLTNLRAAFADYDAQKIALRNVIKNRYVLLAPARQRMKQYRAVVKAKLLPTSSLYLSLPRLSPVAGATPKAVTNLLAFYDATENVLKITFTPSVSKNIKRYELWFCSESKWNPTSAVRIAMSENAPPYQFQFAYTQVAPNQTGLFKVYVMNETDNERGSAVLKVKRAAEMTLATPQETRQTLALAA